MVGSYIGFFCNTVYPYFVLYYVCLLFTVTSEHIRLFYFLVFFCFYTFLVVGSVR